MLSAIRCPRGRDSKEMEVTFMFFLQPARKEVTEIQEAAAAALLDLAGLPRPELFEPKSRPELVHLGIACRLRGGELFVDLDMNDMWRGWWRPMRVQLRTIELWHHPHFTLPRRHCRMCSGS